MNLQRKLQVSLLAIITMFMSSVQSKDAAIAKTLDECPSLHEEGGLECRNEVIERLEQELASIVAAVIDQIKETDSSAQVDVEATASAFKEANALWQQSVDMDCKAQYLSVGIGTDKNNQEMLCVYRHYDDRIKQLQRDWHLNS